MSDIKANTDNQTVEKPYINQYVLIISIFLLILFINFNYDKFSDPVSGNIILFMFLIFEFLFIAGAMEMIKKETYFYKLLSGSFFTYILYKGFMNFNYDILKMIFLILATVSVYTILNAVWSMVKDIIDLDNSKSKFKNAFLFIANLTTFILAIMQILDILQS